MRFDGRDAVRGADRVTYSGKVVILDDPLQMADPKKAFTENPYDEAEATITYTRVSDHVRRRARRAPREAGRGVRQGPLRAAHRRQGTIRVGDEEWDVDGFGLRDHSWGPRYWQAPWYYRWLTANFGPTFGFMGSRIARKDGPGTRGGFVWDGGAAPVRRLRADHRLGHGDDAYHHGVDAMLRSGTTSGRSTGTVQSLIPLRNRRTRRKGALSPASPRA